MCKIIHVLTDSYIHAEIENFDEFTAFGRNVALTLPIDSSFPEMKIQAYAVPDDIFKTGVWTLISENILRVLYSLGAKSYIQIFRADVKLKSGCSAGNYYVLHVLKQVDCFDEINSKFEKKNELYCNVKKLEIIHNNVCDEDCIFRISNFPNSPFILNSRAAKEFKNSDLKGIEYFSIEEWNQSELI